MKPAMNMLERDINGVTYCFALRDETIYVYRGRIADALGTWEESGVDCGFFPYSATGFSWGFHADAEWIATALFAPPAFMEALRAASAEAAAYFAKITSRSPDCDSALIARAAALASLLGSGTVSIVVTTDANVDPPREEAETRYGGTFVPAVSKRGDGATDAERMEDLLRCLRRAVEFERNQLLVRARLDRDEAAGLLERATELSSQAAMLGKALA